MKKVMLVIRDGWGYSEQGRGNAIMHAKRPFDRNLLETTPQVLLTCHGQEVGLPPGFQGSSEVGHLNMGAGRIVEQEVTRIFKAISDGTLFETPHFLELCRYLETPGACLHFIGLLQDEGVHGHQEHLFLMMRLFAERYPQVPQIIHPIADGRDTPPRSFASFYRQLLTVVRSIPNASIGTIQGRYYAMDRSKKWNLTTYALRAFLLGEGRKITDGLSAVESAYASETTPDGVPMTDEYLRPMIVGQYSGMKPGDVVINFNYRQDRAIQISKAFVESDCPSYAQEAQAVHYFGLTRYYDSFQSYLMEPMSDDASMQNLLGEIVSKAGYRQLRIAETQKFRHVTSFFNGKRTEPYQGEEQIEIPSLFDPASFASHPEMNAEDVTRELLNRLQRDYQLIVVNYANCDMVGHTGDYEAARCAADIVDSNVQRVAEAAVAAGYTVLITADHGNSEEMIDERGEPKTSHSINPVKLHVLSRNVLVRFQRDSGILSDITALILRIMDLQVPQEITSRGFMDAQITLI